MMVECTENNTVRVLKSMRLGRLALKGDGWNTDKLDECIAEAEADIRKTEDAKRE